MSPQNSGFTLIEILIVIVIVSILTVLGVQMISSGSIERTVQSSANKFRTSFDYACELASLQNRIYGVKFYESGYAFSTYFNQQWQDVTASEALLLTDFKNGLKLDLLVDGRPVILKDELPNIPQIICEETGQISTFELNINNSSNSSVYQIKPKDFWNLEGFWINEN